METGNLKNRWNLLFDSSDTDKKEKAFQNLVNKYSERHRHYHTLQHVYDCLKILDDVSKYIVDYSSLGLAIWFHDIIYDPKQNDNEEMSVKYATSFFQTINMNPVIIKKIESLIMLTKHPSNPVTSDEKYLADIDISILGASNERFDLYESSIRKEYAFVPSIFYEQGRMKVLNSFLEAVNIYKTDYFRERYEVQARRNINRILNKLSS